MVDVGTRCGLILMMIRVGNLSTKHVLSHSLKDKKQSREVCLVIFILIGAIHLLLSNHVLTTYYCPNIV